MSEKKRILFVDDDELILSCFERLLGRRFEVDVAANGAQAIQAMTERGPYDAVISDMKMPGMNGIELLTRTKELSPQTVGLLWSGNSEYEEVENAVSSGIIFRVLQKPCPPEELIQAVQEALAV